MISIRSLEKCVPGTMTKSKFQTFPYQQVLVTGGAGFVGCSIALRLKAENPGVTVTAFDNLYRSGSQLNVPRLKEAGVLFIRGDVRNVRHLARAKKPDLIIDCAAEPSVLAGSTSSPEYLVQTNLVGTLNCLELARKARADILLFSTSRVYPLQNLNALAVREGTSRFTLQKHQRMPGASARGITERFPLDGARSLYGATKLAAELMVQEYATAYGIHAIIDRCGVIAGPWQMGKVDQGVVALWVAYHLFNKPLSYIGYGGGGKQVRDFVHIDDLYDLVMIQLADISSFNGEVYNVGGGLENSFSLRELTEVCQEVTGNHVHILSVRENRPNDVKVYISDCSRVQQKAKWRPRKNLRETVEDIARWIQQNERVLRSTLI